MSEPSILETPTTDEIYRILEKEIITLRIMPGDVLSESQMCRRFGLSRTPVRSVLQRLQQNGFVQILPSRGTVVTPIDLQTAQQIIYMRVAIETMVLRDFVRSGTPIQVEQVRHAYQQMCSAAETLQDAEAFDINRFLDIDLTMHSLWFRFTGKDYLWQTVTKPHPDYARFIRLDIVGGSNVADVLREHQELMRIIDERDEAAIEPLLTRHLYGGVRRLGEKMFSEEYKSYFA